MTPTETSPTRAPRKPRAPRAPRVKRAPSVTPEGPPVGIHVGSSCKGNPGPGGWACVMRKGDRYLELSGAEAASTSNRMELMAAIQGLERLTVPSAVTVVTCSDYLRKGMTQWARFWAAKGWRGAQGQAVKNADLWQRLMKATETHGVAWQAATKSGDSKRAGALARQVTLRALPVRTRKFRGNEGVAATAPSAPLAPSFEAHAVDLDSPPWDE